MENSKYATTIRYTLIGFWMNFMGQFTQLTHEHGLQTLTEITSVQWIILFGGAIASGLYTWHAKTSDSPKLEQQQSDQYTKLLKHIDDQFKTQGAKK